MIFPFNLVLPGWRKGSVLSRIFRLIFETKQTKKLLGISLIFLVALSGSLSPVFGLTNDVSIAQSEEKIITSSQAVIITQETFQKPVVGEISQGFHWYHQAIDIARNDNAEVFPVATGKVVEIGYQIFGYGNYIIIKHGDELTSLYGHLKTINVGPGEEVKKDTVLGIIGSTGHSTGPHLHLEISVNENRINPLSVIESFYSQE